MVRIVGNYGVKKIGSVIDTDDRLEAIKMFIEKLQEMDKSPQLDSLTIDNDVEYI